MNKLALVFAATSLALGGCAHNTAGPTAIERGEARLAQMLEGRVAGEPQSCISALVDRRFAVIDHTAVVYDAGDTVWVARPTEPHSLDTRDILVVERFGSQICKQDVIRTVDRSSGILTGVVFLGDFIPYRRR